MGKMKSILRRVLLQIKKIENNFKITLSKRQIRKAYDQRPALFSRALLIIPGAVLGIFGIYFLVSLEISLPGIGAPRRPSDGEDSSIAEKRATPEEKSDSVDDPDSVEQQETGAFSREKQEDMPLQRNSFRTQGEDFSSLLVADKNDRVLHLFRRTDFVWNHIRAFPIASGSRPGMKNREGDLRTPQGIYFIVQKKNGNRLHQMYGPYSLVLNYPNRHDSAAGRTGSGIWIHGTAPDEFPIETKGCLALHNDNIKKLYNAIHEDTLVPVVIHDRGGMNFEEIVDLEKIIAERQYILNKNDEELALQQKRDTLRLFFSRFVESWKDAWESMDMVTYRRFYDTSRFSAPGHTWQSWKKHKAATFERYSKISIAIDSLTIDNLTDTSATVEFRQVYESDVFRSVAPKTLSVRKTEDNWKIITEISG
ncbi:MAG: L,D-transpeptidase family protein [Fibrobacterota bacterium]